jgi:hypothetical protein
MFASTRVDCELVGGLDWADGGCGVIIIVIVVLVVVFVTRTWRAWMMF